MDGILIQCRLSSTRLPCKAMLSLGGVSILGRVIQRVKGAGLPTFVVTSDSIEDEIIKNEAILNRADGVYRGPLHDVRQRMFDAAKNFGLTRIVRVTADNPFTEPSLITKALIGMSSHHTYARCAKNSCPDGVNIECFTLDSLEESVILDFEKKDLYDMEHVTPEIIKRAIQKNSIYQFHSGLEFAAISSEYFLTVDTEKDYVRAAALFDLMKLDNLDFENPGLLEFIIKKLIKNEKGFFNKGRRHAI